MATMPLPSPDGQSARALDWAIERELREEVRTRVDSLLGERQLLAPGPADEVRIRALVREVVAGYQRRAATTNRPLIDDPAGVERRLQDGLLGLGPLQMLLDDPTCEEVVCNGGRVFAWRNGRKELVQDVYFEDDAELLALVKRVVGPLGRRLDESSPMVDARLPDGSRLNAVIPPAATRWTCVSLRKFLLRASSLDELVSLGTLTEAVARFLDASVQAGVNILVSGQTGSGKTTLLNALGSCVASQQERLVVVEETAELQLDSLLPDCVALQARAANVEGAGEIRIRDLVKNALRMRPSRICVGEVRGGEALDLLLAMNTGHDGSFTSLHANGPRDALDRLATLAAMAEEHVPLEVLTRMVARTVELVVQVRLEPLTGRRRVSHVFEVTGQEGGVVTGNDLWVLDPSRDRLAWTGIKPRCTDKMAARGVAYAAPAGEGSP
jgi:pilus assembly protein CpaF